MNDVDPPSRAPLVAGAANVQVQHDARLHRFEAIVDGKRCELDYLLEGTVMTIVHTGVPPALEGRGIAAALVRSAMAAAREAGWSVVPRCSYAAVYLRRHPELVPGPEVPPF